MKHFFLFTFVFFSILTNSADAFLSSLTCGPHRLYVAPEFFSATRDRGGKQTGVLYGGRSGYDRIHRFSLYWGVEGHYAIGNLNGKSQDVCIESNMCEYGAEGRIGYNLQQKSCYQLSFIPFAGYGYHNQSNTFIPPTPRTYRSTESFYYTMLGFRSSATITCNWKVGLTFKAQFMRDAKCSITKDPYRDDATMEIANRVQYSVELPIIFSPSRWCSNIDVSGVAFYRFRDYGQKYGEYDFNQLQFQIFGARVEFAYSL